MALQSSLGSHQQQAALSDVNGLLPRAGAGASDNWSGAWQLASEALVRMSPGGAGSDSHSHSHSHSAEKSLPSIGNSRRRAFHGRYWHAWLRASPHPAAGYAGHAGRPGGAGLRAGERRGPAGVGSTQAGGPTQGLAQVKGAFSPSSPSQATAPCTVVAGGSRYQPASTAGPAAAGMVNCARGMLPPRHANPVATSSPRPAARTGGGHPEQPDDHHRGRAKARRAGAASHHALPPPCCFALLLRLAASPAPALLLPPPATPTAAPPAPPPPAPAPAQRRMICACDLHAALLANLHGPPAPPAPCSRLTPAPSAPSQEAMAPQEDDIVKPSGEGIKVCLLPGPATCAAVPATCAAVPGPALCRTEPLSAHTGRLQVSGPEKPA